MCLSLSMSHMSSWQQQASNARHPSSMIRASSNLSCHSRPVSAPDCRPDTACTSCACLCMPSLATARARTQRKSSCYSGQASFSPMLPPCVSFFAPYCSLCSCISMKLRRVSALQDSSEVPQHTLMQCTCCTSCFHSLLHSSQQHACQKVRGAEPFCISRLKWSTKHSCLPCLS